MAAWPSPDVAGKRGAVVREFGSRKPTHSLREEIHTNCSSKSSPLTGFAWANVSGPASSDDAERGWQRNFVSTHSQKRAVDCAYDGLRRQHGVRVQRTVNMRKDPLVVFIDHVSGELFAIDRQHDKFARV